MKRLAFALAVTAGLSAGVAVPATAAVICNRYCDGRDPALSPADRQPVSSVIWGRRIILHLNDNDAMAWGSIENGSAGDRVWLDRSFDGNRTWEGRLGDTAVPSGQRAWRTLMYNNDNWAGQGVGALRACGKAGDRPEITCTAWARTTWNAWDRRTAAATGLMAFYNQGNGLFNTTGWWNSANALTAVINNIRVTGMNSYRYAISTTFSRHASFNNEYLDDTGWWALAWIAAYDLTGESRYLNMARSGADHMFAYWDGVCGGGIWWSTARTYKAAIANSLYLQVNAALHNRIPGDTAYLQRANASWSWIQAAGLINSANLVNDGISLTTCRNNGSTVWSYNQGVPVAGLVELHRATGNAALLTRARDAESGPARPSIHDISTTPS